MAFDATTRADSFSPKGQAAAPPATTMFFGARRAPSAATSGNFAAKRSE